MTDILYSFIGELTMEDDTPNQLIESLLTAEDGDTITMTFRSDGGCVATMTAILNAMKFSKATTVGVLLSHAYSAASFIFLACDEHVVGDHTALMCHPSYAGMDGSWNDINARSAAYKLSEKGLVDEYYKGFLTPREIKKAERQEVWLGADEIRKRLSLTSLDVCSDDCKNISRQGSDQDKNVGCKRLPCLYKLQHHPIWTLSMGGRKHLKRCS